LALAVVPAITACQAHGEHSHPKEAPMATTPNSYAAGSVFTIDLVLGTKERRHAVEAPTSDVEPNKASFDLAVVQFKDDGTYLNPSQIDAAEDCIRKARTSKPNSNGAMVIVFIHGWHHGAHWKRTASTTASDPDGDDHFHSFRLILESLALREAERYSAGGKPAGRRVVGVYIGWNGDPEGSWISGLPIIRHGTFWNRYRVAERIGGHAQFRESIRRVVNSTKEPVTVPTDQPPTLRPESPLVLIGHSMGALMLQSAYAALLEDQQQPLQRQRLQPAPATVAIRSGDTLVSFPDLVLSLNSAADSAIAKRIIRALEQRSMKKDAAAGEIRYSPPLLISVTSTADSDTRDTWARAKPGRKTDGNDSSLFTHSFVLGASVVTCKPGETVDMGQNWHCLRRPQPPSIETPDIPIDLPTRERNGRDDVAVPHARYVITATGDKKQPHLMWAFQVPPELIKDHNDIFNSRARSLVLGLIQVSGAVASIAENWEKSFEPY
jgi:hypothetical protein